MTRFEPPVAASAALAACGLILTGCGSGRFPRSPARSPPSTATRPTSRTSRCATSTSSPTVGGDYLQPGKIVPLLFAAANNSADVNDSW